MRSWRLLLLLLALHLDTGPARAAPGIDPALLTRIERELTIAICGVGYLDTRAEQLAALGSFDKRPYLEHLARQRTNHLSVLAVQLLGRERAVANRRALERIEADAQAPDATRFEAARQLATVFRSRAGKARLDAALGAADVQRRADALSALFTLVGVKELGPLVELAADEHQYAVDRFVSELFARRAFKKPALELLRQRHAKARGAKRARYAFARMLLGEPAHAAEVKQFLLGYTGPVTDEALYNLAWMCHELAERGHSFAFDAVLHLASLYRRARTRAFNWYLLSVFYEKGPFDRKLVDGQSEDDAARILGAWWSTHSNRAYFDGQRFRLR